MDQSMVDISENNKASFSISEAQNGLCAYRQLDPGMGSTTILYNWMLYKKLNRIFLSITKFKGPVMEFLDIFESRPLAFTPSIYPCSITGKFFRVGNHLFFFKKTYTGIDSPF